MHSPTRESKDMRLVSWNVNGLRAVLNKQRFYPAFAAFDADIFALQEIKAQPHQVTLELPPGYHQTWCSAQRKGYSGTAVFSKTKPLGAIHSLDLSSKASSGHFASRDPLILNSEGRLCVLEFEPFWLVNAYTPNSQDELARLDLRLAWGAAFTRFVSDLARQKSVVICGDLNVAHQEIDLARPAANRQHAGFSDAERADFSSLLEAGFIDTFRHLYPNTKDAYSWWSFRGNARQNNTGWRIDYFLVSNDLAPAIIQASIWPQIEGSDHCPVSLELALE
jgi:exodeoxyribonuclease-3